MVTPSASDEYSASHPRARLDSDGIPTPFSDERYVSAAARAAGFRTERIDAGDGVAALVAWRRIGPFRQAVIPPLAPYSALFVPDTGDESSVHNRTDPMERLADALESRFDDIHLHLPPEKTDLRPLQWRGWIAQPRYTYRINLPDGADPGAWSESARRTFRRSAADYTVEDAPGESAAVAALCAEAYGRSGRTPPLSADSMRALAGELEAMGMARTVVARADDQSVHAGIVLLSSGTTSFYWMAGSIPGSAMTILLGTLLPLLAADGTSVLDLVGANTPRVAEFKRRFGADLVPYHSVRYTGNRLLKSALAIRNLIAG